MKKVLLMCVSMLLVAALSIGGTLAYLTSTDSAVNVMTVGNVKIEQIEQEWGEDDDGNEALVPFQQSKPALPYVGDLGWEKTDYENGAYRRFTMENVIDKYVSVKNIGLSDAYVRTIIALEMGTATNEEFDKWVGYSINALDGSEFDFEGAWEWDFIGNTTIDGNGYYLMVATHNAAIKSGYETIPSLLQAYIDKEVNNAEMTKLDGNGNGFYEILAFSQAVQAAGFTDAKTALDEAFDPITATNHPWGDGIVFPSFFSDVETAKAALTTLPDGTDITKNVSKIVFGKPSGYPEIVNGGYESEVNGATTAYYVPDGTMYTVYMLSEDPIYAPANSKGLFQDMSSMTEIDLSNFDVSKVENALGMFANCSNLTSLDVDEWDVSNMTNMQSIFYGCNKLENIDVSEWDTSNVTNMRMVFFRCYLLPNDVLKGVEGWDVSNVSNFYSMFKHAKGLTSLDLSKWDTRSATNMSHMFANIGGLEYLDLSSFDTSKVTDMSWMFYDASKLTTIHVGDGWSLESIDLTKPTCFYNNQALVGGNGTTWLDVCVMANSARPWESSAKLDYAIVDGGTANPGLLTYKNN